MLTIICYSQNEHVLGKPHIELCLRREGVRIIDPGGLRKHHFTAHGLHPNGTGKPQSKDKRLLASAIVKELARPSSSPSRHCSLDPRPDTTPPRSASMYLESYAEAVTNGSHTTSSQQAGELLFLGNQLPGRDLS
ncbi:hypothetical protein J6590_000791 [Homalodisca vitripennis]|nr:hypothetical protein J6590_000791 [Homalodisca vitripennis]